MSKESRFETRDQRIVTECLGTLPPPGNKGLTQMRSRARELPSMLRRHGLLQVLHFLTKNAGDSTADPSDGDLATHLCVATHAALGRHDPNVGVDLYRDWLARQGALEYLRHQEAAAAAAAWLKLLIEGRTASGSKRATASTEAP